MKVFTLKQIPQLCAGSIAEGCYLLFDCPGQVELFTLHDALNKMLKVMTDDWNLRCRPPHRRVAHRG